MEPITIERIINKCRYSTKTATLVAHDNYWNGRNFEQHGRNRFLYRTKKSNYFLVTLTMWQGERDTLNPITQEEAITLYERDLCVHEVGFGEAFPDVSIEDA